MKDSSSLHKAALAVADKKSGVPQHPMHPAPILGKQN